MYQQYINGKLVDGLGKPLDVLDPSTGEVVGTVGSANAAQAQQALDAAAEAFKTWSKTPLQTRIDWMLKLREACLAERETLVELVSRESGRTYALACGDFDWCMTSFQYTRRRSSASTARPSPTRQGRMAAAIISLSAARWAFRSAIWRGTTRWATRD